MKAVLLDTCVLLWWFSDTQEIKRSARKIIENPDVQVFASAVSFWEIAIKQSLNRISVPHNFLEIVRKNNFEILSIEPEHTLGILDLPGHHGDPFDRLLIAQAKYNGLDVITRDKAFKKYPVDIIHA